jgi:hypothetical protein
VGPFIPRADEITKLCADDCFRITFVGMQRRQFEETVISLSASPKAFSFSYLGNRQIEMRFSMIGRQ